MSGASSPSPETAPPAPSAAARTARTVVNTVLYSLSSLLQRASSLIFFPIFSRYLDGTEYGILAITQSMLAFLTPVATLELLRTVPRFVRDRSESGAEVMAVLFTSLLAMTVPVALLLHFLGGWLARPFLGGIPYFPFLACTVYALPFLTVYNLYMAYLRATHQGRRYVVTDLLFFVSNVGLNLALIILFRLQAMGIILSTLVSAVLFFGYSVARYFWRGGLRWRWAALRELLAYSLPLVPYILLGIVVETMDRFFLNAWVSTQVTGLYYIASTLGGSFSLFKEAAYSAFSPWFFESCETESPRYVNRVIEALFLVLCLLGLGLAWFAHEILRLLSSNAELITAWVYVPLIVDAQVLVFLGQILSLTIFHGKQRIKYLPASTVVGGAVTLVLCVLLVRPYGAYGASLAKLAGFAAMTAVIGLVARGATTFRFAHGRLVAITAGCLGLSALAYAPLEFYRLLALKAALYLLSWGAVLVYLDRHFSLRALLASRWRGTGTGSP